MKRGLKERLIWSVWTVIRMTLNEKRIERCSRCGYRRQRLGHSSMKRGLKVRYGGSNGWPSSHSLNEKRIERFLLYHIIHLLYSKPQWKEDWKSPAFSITPIALSISQWKEDWKIFSGENSNLVSINVAQWKEDWKLRCGSYTCTIGTSNTQWKEDWKHFLHLAHVHNYASKLNEKRIERES